MFLNKIPFLKNVDFTDRTVKAKALLLAGATVVTVVLLIIIFYVPSDSPEGQTEQPSVVAPVPEMQMGEDNDALDGKQNKDVYGKGQSRNPLEDLFEKKETDVNDDPLGELMETGDPEPVPAHDIPLPSQQPSTTSPGTIKPGSRDIYGRMAQNLADGERAGKDEREAERQRDEDRKKKRAEDNRKRLIAMGIDPDTGQPLSQPTGQQPSGTSSQTPAPASSSPSQPSQPESRTETPVNPEIVTETHETVDDDDSFGLGTTGISSLSSQKKKNSEKLTVKVMFIEERKVKSGDRVQLRLCEDKGITVEGVHIPKNSLLYATVSLGDRLMIHVPSVNVNGVIVPLNLDAFDVDGLPGIYCPTSEAQEALKEAGRDAKELALGTVSGLMRTFGARMVSSGRSASERVGNQSYAYITSGYTFNLMKGD